MTQKIEDLRIRRTRKALMEAMITLTIEKGFADVTVQDITERAMVNRSTFYRHYLDKYDLLSQYIGEMITMLSLEDESHLGEPLNACVDQSTKGILRILKHIQMNDDFYRALLGKKGDLAFCAQVFRQFIETQFHSMLTRENPHTGVHRPPLGLSVNYVLHAGIGAVVWWLENNQPMSPEELADWLNQFSRSDISVSLGMSMQA